jgi:hypothetical protein
MFIGVGGAVSFKLDQVRVTLLIRDEKLFKLD